MFPPPLLFLSPSYTEMCYSQIRELETEVFRLLKQNGSQVNNNNNIFERQTSVGEVSRGDGTETMDAKQMSGLDTLNQGLSKPDDKLDNCTVSV